jgi:hypothetical protein
VRRVTLDTNVYISALNFGGQPKRLLDMAISVLFENPRELTGACKVRFRQHRRERA